MSNVNTSYWLGIRYTLSKKHNRSVAFISRLAMTGIVLGVALLIIVLSVMNGFDRELRERILRIMPQLTVYHHENVTHWQALRQQLLEYQDIVAVTPFVEVQAMLHKGKDTEPTLVYGVSAEYEATVSIIHQFLSEKTLKNLNEKPNQIVLGKELAQKLGVKEGDQLSLIVPRTEGTGSLPAVRRLHVLSILNTGTEVDQNLSLMGLQSSASLLSSKGSSAQNQVSGVRIRLNDMFDAPVVGQQLQWDLPPGYYTTNWTRTHGNLFSAIQMSKNLVGLIVFLIIAIAAFNVVSTLVMVVIDKQVDVAILRTLGMTTRQIMMIFITQGLVIGLLGTLIGGLSGVVLSWWVQDIIEAVEWLLNIQFLSSDIYPVSYVPAELWWGDVVNVVIVSFLMSLLSTLYPAYRAAKIAPAEALRYD